MPKYQHLQNILKSLGRVLIAFSGGTDSTLLLKVAKDILHDDVMAATAVSEITPRHEHEDAVRFAGELNVRIILLESRELDIPEFVKNPPDRCYICKKSRFGAMLDLAREMGFPYLADGENLDDQSDYRPGSRAARELSVRSPLREAGMTKAEIRSLSKKLNLPTYDKPADACLASRIPYHSPITAEKLRQVEESEAFLREMGLNPRLRVRHYGETARIESDAEDIPKLTERAVRALVVKRLRELGFKFVTLDLEGYQMGSLNRVINNPGVQK